MTVRVRRFHSARPRYGRAFDTSYIELYTADVAVIDAARARFQAEQR